MNSWFYMKNWNKRSYILTSVTCEKSLVSRMWRSILDNKYILFFRPCTDDVAAWKEQKARDETSQVAWLLFFSRCDGFCDLLQYIRTGKFLSNLIYLFHALKTQMVYCKDLRGMKKENQVWWCDFPWIWRRLCLYTPVSSLYIYIYIYISKIH